MSDTPHGLALVRDYWEEHPCGSQSSDAAPGTDRYFQDLDRTRYEEEPAIPAFAGLGNFRGRRILEVGIGSATDFVGFVRHGAVAFGVDLTEAATHLAHLRLQREGLHAALCQANAESLPFPDDSFDYVYSWGVLHHSPDTARAVNEVLRVLRPGGEVRVMLYSRTSVVGLWLWLKYALLRGDPWRSTQSLFASHYESPGTKAFTRDEIRALFARFANVTLRHLPTRRELKRLGPLVRIAPHLALFVGVSAAKPFATDSAATT